jgi:radical SAM superfamily enzyme YgiQ (UPF0313 family)
MLTLINVNRMAPLVAPIGLDYVAGAARATGIQTEVVDLALAEDPAAALRQYFAAAGPHLIGISFRNVDDCFWPSAGWFVPDLVQTIQTIRDVTDAPIVLGGVGFSIFAEEIVGRTGADFGVRGDGEAAVVGLYRELAGARQLERVPGLVWRGRRGRLVANPPAWPSPVSAATARDAVDNAAYFRLGGQGAVETKRGCDRRCLYCADPLAKGPHVRRRDPREVAGEFAALAAQGVDVLHLADSEFNVPRDHAATVCEELIRRDLGQRVRWYAYLAVQPFDAELAAAMRRAGCVGINFTADSASEAMLAAYRQPHRRDDIALAVRLCREHKMAVMLDLLLGGPGETRETVAETIDFVKHIDPDCAGAALGIRIYPHTAMAEAVAAEGPPESNPDLRRRYDGPVDFLRPTFYITRALGERPARLVRDLIGGDERFFEPAEEAAAPAGAEAAGYNYNDNTPLVRAIREGARGAYWHILRRMRGRA